MHETLRSRAALGLALPMLVAACGDLVPDPPPAQVPVAAASDSAVAPAPQPAETVEAKPRRRTPSEAEPVPDEEAAAFDQIRRSLRRLVAAEQAFYAETGTYTEDLGRIRFRPEGRVQTRFLWLTREGWAASGSHPAVPGRDCVIFVGRADAPPTSLKYVRSGREGVPTCDVAPLPRRSSGDPLPTPPRAADTASALDALNPLVQMRVDLRKLARAQDAYLGAQGIYSRRVEPLALQYIWHRGVNVRVLDADQRAWAAEATHAGRPGKSCVIWWGPVTRKPATKDQRLVPQEPGEPACDP